MGGQTNAELCSIYAGRVVSREPDSPGPGAELSPRYPHRTQAGQRWFFGAELRKSGCRSPGPEWEQTLTALLHAAWAGEEPQ